MIQSVDIIHKQDMIEMFPLLTSLTGVSVIEADWEGELTQSKYILHTTHTAFSSAGSCYVCRGCSTSSFVIY